MNVKTAVGADKGGNKYVRGYLAICPANVKTFIFSGIEIFKCR